MDEHLLVLSRYSRLGASSRLRTLQFEPWLRQVGFSVEYASLFDDAYLVNLYEGEKKSIDVLRYYAARASLLRRRPKPKLIWLEYEVLPWLPWLIEKALLPSGVPIVTDYDDAVFHRYDLHRSKPVCWILSKKIDLVMRHSDVVTAGNSYLMERARLAGAQNVEFVPTVVDLSAYQVCLKSDETKVPTVGWVGTPETWAAFGTELYAMISNTLRKHSARFKAVGGSLVPETMSRLDIVPWSENSEIGDIQGMDIGVMPLPDTPWSRGKCGYKLIQYMACGLPVVASPVGVNSDVVEHGVNGFLAASDTEWNEAITTLLHNPDLRHRMGQAGRKKVEERYSLQLWGPRVAALLRDVADRNRTR